MARVSKHAEADAGHQPIERRIGTWKPFPLHRPSMTAPPRIDVFNGDADGLCALQQLHLAELAPGPLPAEGGPRLVTGPKREVRLLAGLDAPPGTQVTVLDVSLRENRADVERLLAAGCRVRYFDHHAPGEPLHHPALEAHIETGPGVCTSLLVDRYLGGAQRPWAVAGAFGDNLPGPARAAAEPLRLPPADLEALRELGELLNYNGYGERPEHLHFAPLALFRALRPHADPLAFARTAPEVATLRRALAGDLARAEAAAPAFDGPEGVVAVLPADAWAARVQGVYANRLAEATPGRAAAVAVTQADGTLRISVRAPVARPRGADALARAFGGGGREGAAVVTALAPDALPRFVEAFRAAFGA